MDVLGYPGDYRIGCILAVPVQTNVGVVSHKGLMGDHLGDDELPTVVHNAKLFGQIVETSMSDYLLMAVGPISSEGYPGLLPSAEVLTRARSQIEKPWRLWHNCEHFVAWSHGLPVRSPQLRSAAKSAAKATGVIAGLVLVGRWVL